MILSTEQRAKTSICNHRGAQKNEVSMAHNAPMAKQVTKKSPEPSSMMRQTMAMAVHTAQRLEMRYSVMAVMLLIIFSKLVINPVVPKLFAFFLAVCAEKMR